MLQLTLVHEQMDIYWRLMDLETGRAKQRFAGLRRCENNLGPLLEVWDILSAENDVKIAILNSQSFNLSI
jgi:hypothetical protein